MAWWCECPRPSFSGLGLSLCSKWCFSSPFLSPQQNTKKLVEFDMYLVVMLHPGLPRPDQAKLDLKIHCACICIRKVSQAIARWHQKTRNTNHANIDIGGSTSMWWLTLDWLQVPIKASLSLSSSAGQGKENTVKGLQDRGSAVIVMEHLGKLVTFIIQPNQRRIMRNKTKFKTTFPFPFSQF